MTASSWSSLFDHVYVISLPGSTRRNYINEHLPEVGIHNFSFFNATDENSPDFDEVLRTGEVMTYPPCFRCGKLDCGNDECNNFLVPAQIATFLSYINLWQHITSQNDERILILEDDVVIQPNYRKTLEWLALQVAQKKIAFTPEQACLLRMGWAKCNEHSVTNATFSISNEIRMSNPCHAITKQFAASLLNRLDGIKHTVDVYQHQQAPKPGEAFTILPPIAYETSWSEGGSESTIHPKSIRSKYLRNKGELDAAAANDQQIRKHVKKMYFRPLMITGHPRCGTGYAAKLCQQMGLKIGHEALDRDGISSWMFAVNSAENPWGNDFVAKDRRRFTWRHMIVPVRDPQTAIGSIMRDSAHAPKSYAFRRDHILRALNIDLDDFATPLERAIWSLCGWSRIILSQSPDLVFRIEDGHHDLKLFLRENGYMNWLKSLHLRALDLRPINADKLYQGVTQPKPEITASQWHELSIETRSELEWYCNTFGYKTPCF